ncbi:seryl-tRNA synthetase [Coemansia reversa NRRL 1564]|uniref:serine--tRNA ligase n=1 Tax=Coemansia reversa (strain ATCC 12441 / NRRL 1564) TaxID=763665 RepID=A0A2G5BBV9_COERN|nr:seryl-tRNA synthetase [Coemansia reversa NRRL 1564]|eukprot:PIA16482.1 seryl-tRNA synthetase [Coemansia reversa NRRL 1564]
MQRFNRTSILLARSFSLRHTYNNFRINVIPTRTLKQAKFDYKFIQDNADMLLENAKKRKVNNVQPHRVGELYVQFCKLETAANKHRSTLNAISKKLGMVLGESEANKPDSSESPSTEQDIGETNPEELHASAKKEKLALQQVQAKLTTIETELRSEAAKIPNISHPDTPVGDASQARVIRVEGNLHNIATVPLDGIDTKVLTKNKFLDHYELAKSLEIIDLEAGANVAGSRFHYWKGAGALLELALIQFAMTKAIQAGYMPYITPDAARSSIVDACGFQPRQSSKSTSPDTQSGKGSAAGSGEPSQIYQMLPLAEQGISPNGKNDNDPLCLVATAEIPLVAMYQDNILSESQLPRHLAGTSHCFRAEAGSRGRDTRGIYRLHQFTKVELVTISDPLESDAELQKLVKFQESLYKSLGLTYRVVEMPTEELGASAYQKFDIEAWMPGRKQWGEIASASNCTDYQSRRLGIRLGVKSKRGKVRATQFVHTLNATAVAVPRLVVAILESFQLPNGHVTVPKALKPWMMGISRLTPSQSFFAKIC